MNLILVRHGETEEGKLLILLGGNSQGTLSEKGKQQAREMALTLRNTHLDAVYSSDLARALDTAKEIIKYHEGTPFNIVSALRERDVGNLAGKSFKTADELYALGLSPDLTTGETLEHFQNRLKAFLRSVYKEYKDKVVLFVCHIGVIKAYQNIMGRAPPSEINKQNGVSTGASLILDIKFSDVE